MIQEELVGVIITAKLRLLRRRQREKTWQHEPDSFSVLCISTVKKTLAADSYSVLCISTVTKKPWLQTAIRCYVLYKHCNKKPWLQTAIRCYI